MLTKSILIFPYGNPSRGDDALGPSIYSRLESLKIKNDLYDNIILLTDFQLQIEHALDLQGHDLILFVDASFCAQPPFEFHELTAEQDISYTTHAMSPQSVLSVYQQIQQSPHPSSFLLSVRGYRFELGEPISPLAQENLEQSLVFIRNLLSERGFWGHDK